MADLKGLDRDSLSKHLDVLVSCNICPRHCSVNRLQGERGYCNAGGSFSISSICIHRGEEPAISGNRGICNIFFTNCNLQCIFCQNHQISSNCRDYDGEKREYEWVLSEIISILGTGINIVGFVSPTHFIPQVKMIIDGLRELGYKPSFVYNTNGYDTVESVRGLRGYIDIYLPDYKYAYNKPGKEFSDAPGYPEIALAALKEMYRQVGHDMKLKNDGYATSGMIIRHLVLPGNVSNSLQVLRNIAEHLSPEIPVSLMSQYYPTHRVEGHPSLGRTLNYREYSRVVGELEALGFTQGWVQHLESHGNYRPDFMRRNPFEE